MTVPPIELVPTSVTAFVGTAARGPVDEPVQVSSATGFERVFGGRPPAGWPDGLGQAVAAFFGNGGSHAVVVRVSGEDVGAYVGPGARRDGTGLYALHRVDHLNLLVLPPPVPGTDLDVRVWPEALALARSRRAFLLVDPPAGLTDPRAVHTWVGAAGLLTADAGSGAVHAPRLLVDGPAGAVAASGHLAGLYARTDAAGGVWRAPAGPEAVLLGARGLDATYSQRELEEAPPGVNLLRVLPGRPEPVVWGARTLAGSGELAHVPVRRLLLAVEDSIERGTRWAATEVNAEPLWSRLRVVVEGFCLDLFRRGALRGATHQEAYVVRCDATTTTAADVEAGWVEVVLGLAVQRPGEFVLAAVRQRAARPPGPGPACSDPGPELEARLAGTAAAYRSPPDGAQAGPLLLRGGTAAARALAARLLAAHLGTPLLLVDLSQVVDERVAQTEKSLRTLLAAAERAGAVLLLDEADALFGRRSEDPGGPDAHARLVARVAGRLRRGGPPVLLGVSTAAVLAEDLLRPAAVVTVPDD